MAAPTPATRSTPSGRPLGDGHQTLVAFTSDQNIEFWEQEVTPPGLDAGDALVITTMHNTRWRTKHAPALVDMTDMTIMVAYDPVLYTAILALLGVNTTVTVHFPDHSSLAFYGYLKSFEPDALKENEQPKATITVVPTNADPTTCAEEGPVYTDGPGTTPC